MEISTWLVIITTVIGIGSLAAYWHLKRKSKPKEGEVQAQFALVTAGCLTTIFLLSGIIASIVSIAATVYKFLHGL